MNKTELIDKIADQTQLEKTKVAKIVNSFLDVVTEALAKHDSVTLIGFGTFKVRRRRSRRGVNPQTRKEMTIPASDVPVFSAGESLKESVVKKKKIRSFVTVESTGKRKQAATSRKKTTAAASPKKTSASSSRKKK